MRPAPARDALYHDPALIALYDRLNADTRDLAFYEGRIGPAPRRVLDLGCGTGAFAVRLAARRHVVTGVDPSADMLARARRRDTAGAVHWMHGEIGDVPEHARFDAIVMTGHVFQCLLDDAAVAAVLAGARRRLTAGGTLMFDSRNPLVRPWTRWTPATSARTIPDHRGRPVTVHHALCDVAGDRVSFETHYRFEDRTMLSLSVLRFLPRDAIVGRLEAAGFADIAVFGDWDGSGFDGESAEIIVLAA